MSTAGEDSGIVDAALASVGRCRRVAVTVPSFPAAVWIVAASDLIATLPKAITDRATRHQVAVRTPPIALPSSDAYLWWHPRVQNDPYLVAAGPGGGTGPTTELNGFARLAKPQPRLK